MKAWFSLLKARTALLVWAVVVVAGVAPVLGLAALVAWQLATFFQTRSWVALPVPLWWALAGAVIGGGIAALGVRGVLGKRAEIGAQRQKTEERLRRVQDYRSNDGMADTLDGRREPFIASPPATSAPRRAGVRG
jgi:lysylphosphatidylglycerol synthetase-like protein (DUF2156 family)